MDDPRMNVQSGPFKGKPQQWFTRAEVLALLTGKAGAQACACGEPKRAGWTHRSGWCNEGGRAAFETGDAGVLAVDGSRR